MKKKKTIISAIIILLICCIILVFWGGTDGQLEKAQAMQKEMFGEGKRPTPEQWKKWQEQMKKLSPEQHRELSRPMREQWARRAQKKIDDYFELPSDKRKDYLDKEIDRQEDGRKEWEKGREEREKRRRERDANRGSNSGAGSGKGGQGSGNANRGRPGGRRSPTPEQRAQRRNRWLDHASPERRAKWSAYHDAMRKRRIERGLPAHPWGRR